MRIFRKIMIAIICAGFVFAAGYGIASDPNYESMIVKTKEPIPAPEYDRLLRATKSLYMKQISAFREDLKSSPFYKISHPFKGRWLNIIPIRTEPWQLFHDPIFVGELRNVSDIDFRWPRFFGAEEPMAFRTQLDDFTWRERNSMPQYFKWNLELIQGLIANPDANIPRVDNDIYNTVQKFDGLYADSFMATRRFISILHNEVDDIYRYGEFALQNAYAPFPTDPWADPQEVPEEYYEAFKGVGISTSVSNVLRKFYRYFIKAPPLHPEGIDLAKSFLADATMSREELSYLVKVITQALLNYDNGWNAQFFSELPTKQEECFSDMLAQGNAPFNSGMCIEYDLDENIDPGRCRCMRAPTEDYNPQPRVSTTEVCHWAVDWQKNAVLHGPVIWKRTWLGDVGDFFTGVGEEIWGGAEWAWDKLEKVPSYAKKGLGWLKELCTDVFGACECWVGVKGGGGGAEGQSGGEYDGKVYVRGGSECGEAPSTEAERPWEHGPRCKSGEDYLCPFTYENEGKNYLCLRDQVKVFAIKASREAEAAYDNAYGVQRYTRHLLSEVVRYTLPLVLPPEPNALPRYKIYYSYDVPWDMIGYYKRGGEYVTQEGDRTKYYPWDDDYRRLRYNDEYVKLNALFRSRSFYSGQMSPAQKAATLTHFLVYILQDLRDGTRPPDKRLGTDEIEASLAAALVMKYAPDEYKKAYREYRILNPDYYIQETPEGVQMIGGAETPETLEGGGSGLGIAMFTEPLTLPFREWRKDTEGPDLDIGQCAYEFGSVRYQLPHFSPLDRKELQALSFHARLVVARLYVDMLRRHYGEMSGPNEFGSYAFQFAHWVGMRLGELARHLDNAAQGREDELIFTLVERTGNASALLLSSSESGPKAEIAIGGDLLPVQEGSKWKSLEEGLGAMLHQYIHWFMLSNNKPRTPYWEETHALLAQGIALTTAARLNPDLKGAGPKALKVAFNALLDDNMPGARLAAAAASGRFGRAPTELSRHEIEAIRATRSGPD